MWISYIKGYLLLTFFIFHLHFAKALNTDSAKADIPIVIDSSSIQIRQPDTETQNDLLNNPDYKYDRKVPSPDWWDRFNQWLHSRLNEITTSKGGRLGIDILYYLFAAAGVIAIILLLLKNNIRGLFYGKSASLAIDFKELDEDIHKINFNELIKAAISENNYRRAVRLHFLKLLKELTDKNQIAWRIDKTNNDYFVELSNSAYGNNFKELAFLYEHIWYGNFELNENDFNTVLTKFNSLKV